MTHILQHQHGRTVGVRRFGEVVFGGPDYDYRLEPGRRFEDYGIEQQAAIVEDYYRMAVLQRQPRNNLDYRGVDNGQYLQAYKALLNVDSNGVIHVYGC